MSEQGQDLANSSLSNPYVGPRSLQRGEALYGRDYEQQHLLDLLIAERIVLLYSPSGAGKTSLIQAGIIPELALADFSVLPVIRVNQEPPPDLIASGDQANGAPGGPNRYVLSALLSLETTLPSVQRHEPAELARLTFEQYFDRYLGKSSAAENTVLVFDQFEEILTTDPANIIAKNVFFAQLGRILRNRNRWLLCSMREDYIAGLEPYLRLVPTRLATTFRLDLLDVEEAREAAMRPARDAGRSFDPIMVQQVIDDLRRAMIQRPDGITEAILGRYVEPLHLQVVFRRLWEQLHGGNGQSSAITADTDVDSALAEYYEQEIRSIVAKTGVSERAIREWFEQKLITEHGIRNQVRQGPDQSDGLDNRAIRALVDSHLVRSEPRLGATWFELAHDRLIKPIRTSNAAWIERNLSLLQRQTTLWIKQGRPQGMLLHDETLEQEERWADAHADQLTPDEQEFLEQCRQARLAQQREIEYNRLREVAYNRSLLVIAILVLLILALVSVGVNIVQQQRAALLQQAARVQQLASQAREAPELSSQKSLLTAIEATRLSQQYALAQLAAQQSLHTTLALIGGTPLIGHSGTVRALAFQPGGQQLATGSADASVRLWRMGAPEHATAALRGHTLGIAALAFSPNGQLLATGGDDGSARLWQVGAPERAPMVLGGHILSVNVLAFSPNGQLLATGDLTGTARLWRVDAPQQPLAVLQSGQNRSLSSVTNLVFGFSRDGKLFAVGGSDGQVQLLRVDAPHEAPMILWPGGAIVIALAFSSDNGTLAVGLQDGKVRRWKIDPNDGTPTPLGEDTRQSSKIISTFAFNPAGTLFATGSTNGSVWLWQLDSLNSAPTVLSGLAQRVSALTFSPKGDYLAAGSDDGTARLWSLNDLGLEPTMLRGHEGVVRALAFSDDERYLATGSDDTTVRLWPIGAPQSEPTLLRGHASEVQAVAFSADNATLISTSRDGTALRWGVGNAVPQPTMVRKGDGGNYVMALSPNNQWLATVGITTTGSTITIELQQLAAAGQPTVVISPGLTFPSMVLFSPDNRLFAIGGSDGTAQIRQADAPQSTPIVVKSGGSGNVMLAFSPDGQTLATGSSNGIVRLWQTNVQAAPIAELHDHTQDVVVMAFDRDGSRLATGSNDGTVRLWNVTRLPPASTVLLSSDDDDNKVSALAFSPNGGMLAAGYEEGTVWLWNATEPQSAPTVLLGRHTAQVRSIAFSPGGELLATASDDTTTHLWQLDTPNAEPVVLRGHQKLVLALAFSSDARYLATGSKDTAVGVWQLQVGDLVARACETVGRNLSVRERQGLGLSDGADQRLTCPALPLHPSFYTTWFLQNDENTAIAAYTAEQQRDPTLEPPAAWLVRQAAQLLQRGQLDRALALYNQALTLSNQAGANEAQLAHVDVQALNQFCLTGTSERNKEALDACDRAVKLAPENGDYPFNRGLVRRRAGDLAGAIQDFENFIAIVSDQPNAGRNVPLAQQWIDEMCQEQPGICQDRSGLPTPTP